MNSIDLRSNKFLKLWERFSQPIAATVGISAGFSRFMESFTSNAYVVLAIGALLLSSISTLYILGARKRTSLEVNNTIPKFERRQKTVSVLVWFLTVIMLIAVLWPREKFQIPDPFFIVFNKNDTVVALQRDMQFILTSSDSELSKSFQSTGQLRIKTEYDSTSNPIYIKAHTNIDFFATFVGPELFKSMYGASNLEITFIAKTTEGSKLTSGSMPFKAPFVFGETIDLN